MVWSARLIPAHAGKTAYRSGEDTQAVGSSPLTRGKPTHTTAIQHDLRLIPAHAGKTRSPESAAPAATAHPRSRGENMRIHVDASACTGSSPLTRGKREARGLPGALDGLIPAHAGKT